jgi:hypothetical protein
MSDQQPEDPYSQYTQPAAYEEASSTTPSSDAPANPYQQQSQQEYAAADLYQQQPQQEYASANPYAPPPVNSYQQQPVNPYAQQPMYPYAPMLQNEPGRGLALAGMILGIISIVAWIIPLTGYPVAIVGIILSALGRRSVSRKGMALAGLILSIIALALTLCNSVLGVLLASHGI